MTSCREWWVPCIWSKHWSQTRESSTGDSGDSNAEMETLRGGLMNGKLETSSRLVERVEHTEQKMPPHLRQCWWVRGRGQHGTLVIKLDDVRTCLRSKMEKRLLQRKVSHREA